MADTDKLRISGLVVAFFAFIMHLIMVSLGYTSLDWGPIMVGGIFYSFKFKISVLAVNHTINAQFK